MKRVYLYLIAILFTGFTIKVNAQQVNAQQSTGTLSGSVNGNDRAVEAATVLLLHEKDSTEVKTVLTEKTGRFSFSGLNYGNYLISVSAVGYNQKITGRVELTPRSVFNSYWHNSVGPPGCSLTKRCSNSEKTVYRTKTG